MTNGATAGAAAAAAIARAIKASGVLVKVEPDEFRKLLERQRDGLVVVAEGGVFGTRYEYLTSYKGLAFHTSSKQALPLGSAEVVMAKKIWIPG